MEQEPAFGTYLRRLRQAVGFSQDDLAERAGLTAKAVSALERGERQRPYPETVRRLADALGLDAKARAELIATVPRRGAPTTPMAGPSETPAAAAEATAIQMPVAPSPATLPVPLTLLVGRAADVAAVQALLRGGERLVTLAGPGGVGKTRLALAVAWTLGERYPDGVVFVPLAPLAEAALVLSTIAGVLGLRPGLLAGGEMLRVSLQPKRLLLVLDNFEHVTAAAAQIATLLEACPALAVLATSREPLRLRGERAYTVEPLTVLREADVPSPEAVWQSPAARLFVERAQAANPAFRLTGETAASVAAICDRLDGLPLALELAAARISLLPPAALLARLDRALPLLVGGARDLPERQRTMRDTIAWSYDLLADGEQTVFRRLSVFAGGCTVAAAEAVCADLEGRLAVLATLSSLADKSLVRRMGGSESTRLQMLEMERQFGLEQLRAHGEETLARDRHAACFSDLATEAEPHLTSAARAPWMQLLGAEHDNLRAALAWSLDRSGAPEAGLRLAAALAWFWFLRGDIVEGRAWLGRALSRWAGARGDERGSSVDLQARLQYGAGGMSWAQGAFADAHSLLADAEAAFRRLDERRRLAYTLELIGLTLLGQGKPTAALAPMRESLSLCRAERNRWGIAYSAQGLALGTWMAGAATEARALFEEGVAVFREVGDPWGEGVALYHMAAMCLAEGDIEAARVRLERSAMLDRAAGIRWELARVLAALGHLLLRVDATRATGVLAEGLRLSRDLGDEVSLLRGVAGVAALAASHGRYEQAALLCWSVPARFAGTALFASASFEETRTLVRSRLDGDTWAALRARGEALGLHDAVAEAFRLLAGLA